MEVLIVGIEAHPNDPSPDYASLLGVSGVHLNSERPNRQSEIINNSPATCSSSPRSNDEMDCPLCSYRLNSLHHPPPDPETASRRPLGSI